jgi:hypothetical protein
MLCAVKPLLSRVVPALLLVACSEEEIKEAAKDAAVVTKEHADRAVEAAKVAKRRADRAAKVAKRRAGDAIEIAKQASVDTKQNAGEAVEVARERAEQAREWVAKNQPKGELSDDTRALLSSAEGGIATTVLNGTQLSPVALQLAEGTYASQARHFHVEAIYQRVGEVADRKTIDAQIADMTRVETIEGLVLGFQDLNAKKAKKAKKAKAKGRTRGGGSDYLVTWVQGQHLAGFVYSSEARVDIEQIVAVMPTVIAKAKPLL